MDGIRDFFEVTDFGSNVTKCMLLPYKSKLIALELIHSMCKSVLRLLGQVCGVGHTLYICSRRGQFQARALCCWDNFPPRLFVNLNE